MIRIEVVAKDGAPLVHPLAAEFDELGGNIGRADAATLVLPDPERKISRTHAAVAFRGGRYVVYDLGTAIPVHVNGRALGNGREAPIQPGDEMQIGPYTLRVLAAAGGIVGSTTPVSGAASIDSLAAKGGAGSQRPRDDPLALFGGGSDSANPFQDLVAPVSRPQVIPSRADARREPPPYVAPKEPEPVKSPLMDDPFATLPQPSSGKGSSGGAIPDDFDFFATSRSSTAPKDESSGAFLPDDLDLGLTTGESRKLDDVFGLDRRTGDDPFAPGNPLSEPLQQPNTAGRDDPLANLGVTPRASTQPTRSDHTPEIHSAFSPPKARLDPAMSAGFDEGTDAKRASADARPAAPSARTRRSPEPIGRAGPPASVLNDSDRQELLRAFLAGAGVPKLDMPGGLTPQLMRVFGQLLREATQGTLDLLVARAIAKRELRAELTTIQPRENNPLKFSPDVEAALGHLLAPEGVGFMTPPRAMRDAYDDLRAHQLAVVAGMRAALAGVLARFGPEELERRLAKKGLLGSLVLRTARRNCGTYSSSVMSRSRARRRTIFTRCSAASFSAPMRRRSRGWKASGIAVGRLMRSS